MKVSRFQDQYYCMVDDVLFTTNKEVKNIKDFLKFYKSGEGKSYDKLDLPIKRELLNLYILAMRGNFIPLDYKKNGI